jgi:hypothetical protein
MKKYVVFFALMILVIAPAALVAQKGNGGGGGGGGHTEVAGNNLSFPVLWAEGVTKAVPTCETPILEGEWWYWWGMEGIDPNIVPLSCAPDPDDDSLCDDGIVGQATGAFPGLGYEPDLVRAYLQKDPYNCWMADSADVSGSPFTLHWIDWGDNLESVDWYTRSQVRTEVVLFQDLDTAMTEYQMRHTSGWGIDEVHGMAVTLTDPPAPMLGDGTRATVYTHCARLTIQKLMVPRDDESLSCLEWTTTVDGAGDGWTESETCEEGVNLIEPHIFNGSVHEGGDGPGYYSAEINVKGRIIFGYTWNVRMLHDETPINGTTNPTAAGDYRITFSLDSQCGSAELNTSFVEGITEIIVPLEEELVTAAAEEGSDGSDTGGAVPVLDFDNNLTYIDVRILERGGGGGQGGRRR